MTLTEPNTIVGKYLISPLTRMLDDGQYAASVSIRSGSGRGSVACPCGSSLGCDTAVALRTRLLSGSEDLSYKPRRRADRFGRAPSPGTVRLSVSALRPH